LEFGVWSLGEADGSFLIVLELELVRTRLLGPARVTGTSHGLTEKSSARFDRALPNCVSASRIDFKDEFELEFDVEDEFWVRRFTGGPEKIEPDPVAAGSGSLKINLGAAFP
jgi:hypothetical protein